MFQIYSKFFRRVVGFIFILFVFCQESMAITQEEFIALPNQKYGLCAGAIAFNFDGVTYAKCQKLKGNSLGLTHAYPPDQNAQTVNKIGTASNTYRVSTYSPPGPSYALYTCTKPGAYAQCNGGLCFENTSGRIFPGLGRLNRGEIMCSCPIESTDLVYNVWGPAACPQTEAEYDAICGAGSSKDKSADGVILRVGSAGPAITLKAFTEYYNIKFGTRYVANECSRPAK